MKKLISILTFVIIIIFAEVSMAAVNLPFSTTYDCAEWDNYDALSCDGMSPGGSWTTASGKYEQITADANYPGGDGGKGQRHWMGPGADGAGNSGGIFIDINSPPTEFWMRWYMRWESGWDSSWNSYKTLYLYDSGSGSGGFQLGNPGIAGIRFWDGGSQGASCSNCGWGYTITAGTWYSVEIHVNLSGAISQVWIDGNIVINDSSTSWGSLSNMASILVGSNIHSTPSTDMYIDYDDIAINKTGYIGPLDANTTAPTVTAFTIPATSSSLTVTFSEAFTATDAVGVTGYCVNEIAAPPTSGTCGGDVGWEASAQTEYVFGTSGAKTLYPWAKDAAGNISDSASQYDEVTIQIPGVLSIPSNLTISSGGLSVH